MGLVRLVTAPVNEVRLPTTPAAMPVAPFITEAAKSEPGILGMDMLGRLPLADGTPTAGRGALVVVVFCRKTGSYLPHHIGT